ncbi:MAG: phosphoribosyl-AMP cyclohydrolase [Candidatus Methylacidiphilales bacterium]
MKLKASALFLAGLLLTLAAVPLAHAQTKVTPDMVTQAVQGWCDALLLISKTSMEGGDAKAVAENILSTAYAYDHGGVLFKPTLTFGDQTFRNTKEGALAYFVGGNPNFPDDSGFALKEWTEATFTTAGILTEGNLGLFMGNVILTNKKGDKVMVDKTFVFRFDEAGKPQIILHKSALPYRPGQ